MRGGRSLLVLLVLALGMGAYIYFVESEREPSGTETKDKAFSVAAADITELTIRSSSTQTATLQRGESGWSLVAPVAAPADSATVESIVSSLESMEIERVLDDNPAALAQFGLEVPPVLVTFKTASGASHQLSLGIDTPTSSGMYARVDDNPRLLIVPAFLKTTFDKAPFDLRNRRVLEVARDTIDRVTLAARGTAPVELRREGVDWRLAAPVAARADFSPADSLLSRLTTAQMSSIVAEGTEPTPAELRTWGLETPQLTVTVGAGSTTATLAIGAAKDGASVYARDLARPIVFTVESSLLTDLRKQPADLRVKDVFAFNAFSALTLDVTHGSTAVAYAKSVPAAGADAAAQPTWARTKPDAGDVNQTALTDLLNALSSLRADRFADQVPATGENVEVAVRFGTSESQTEERVTLRRSGGTVYAIRSGEPGAAVVPTGEFDVVLTHLKTLTTPTPAPTPTSAPQ
jgi:hypothetical protein